MESLPSWEGEILSIFLGDYESPRKPEIKVLVPFSSRSGCPGAVAAASLDSPGLFPCLEEGCVKMFSTYEGRTSAPFRYRMSSYRVSAYQNKVLCRK